MRFSLPPCLARSSIFHMQTASALPYGTLAEYSHVYNLVSEAAAIHKPNCHLLRCVTRSHIFISFILSPLSCRRGEISVFVENGNCLILKRTEKILFIIIVINISLVHIPGAKRSDAFQFATLECYVRCELR